MEIFRQFAIKEEELILRHYNDTISIVSETTITSGYPWDSNHQIELMNDLKAPNFIRFYSVSLNGIFQR